MELDTEVRVHKNIIYILLAVAVVILGLAGYLAYLFVSAPLLGDSVPIISKMPVEEQATTTEMIMSSSTDDLPALPATTSKK